MFGAAVRAGGVMTDEEFQRLLAAVTALSPQQTAALQAALQLNAPDAPAAEAMAADGTGSVGDIEARFALAPCCPHCQGTSITKWGSANRLKRYRCKPCGVTFNALTGTPLAQLHKRELWSPHAQALVDGISLRKVAARLDVHLTTAFRWRHRFLKMPKTKKANVLTGTVEADETYFLRSAKGSRKLARPPRKRGGAAKKRGLSYEQVPVLIARDRHRATTDQILEDRSAASIAAVLEPLVAKSAILVSDGAQVYAAFAESAGVAHVAINLSSGQHRRGIYHIQNVNNYDSRLKTWMRRFNGVATKYLDSYLGWHRLNDREGGKLTASLMLAAAWA